MAILPLRQLQTTLRRNPRVVYVALVVCALIGVGGFVSGIGGVISYSSYSSSGSSSTSPPPSSSSSSGLSSWFSLNWLTSNSQDLDSDLYTGRGYAYMSLTDRLRVANEAYERSVSAREGLVEKFGGVERVKL